MKVQSQSYVWICSHITTTASNSNFRLAFLALISVKDLDINAIGCPSCMGASINASGGYICFHDECLVLVVVLQWSLKCHGHKGLEPLEGTVNGLVLGKHVIFLQEFPNRHYIVTGIMKGCMKSVMPKRLKSCLTSI